MTTRHTTALHPSPPVTVTLECTVGLSPVLNLTITSEGILTCVFRETDTQGGFLDLFSEQVFLVEEENDGSVNEEFVVTDGIEQHKRLVHAILQEEKKPEWR